METLVVKKFLIFVATIQSASNNLVYGNILGDMTRLEILESAQDDTLTSQETDVMSFLDYTTPDYNDTAPYEPENHNIDSWSIMWYLISFGGLITFFLLVSFSEVCCKKSIPVLSETEEEPEVSSPPPYDLFAPPTYDSLFMETKEKSKKGKSKQKKSSIYVIVLPEDKPFSEQTRENPLEFGEVISRNSMGDGEVVTPPPPP